ncbi:MAG: hypothetical protein LBE76_08240 [Nitrososphaerota archaeon]|nr:hypothetical protein [Nitrososphaerota archaeon]
MPRCDIIEKERRDSTQESSTIAKHSKQSHRIIALNDCQMFAAGHYAPKSAIC